MTEVVTDDEVLAGRIAAVRARVGDAARRVGRDPGDVKILPVSKTRPAGLVAQVAQVGGFTSFAENRPQELAGKAEAMPGCQWVLIGPLQSNKASLVARWADQFQALESLSVAAVLDRRLQALGRGIDVMIEVNTSGEATKHGVAADGVIPMARGLAPYASLRPVGLMTVAVNSQDTAAVRVCFKMLRQLRGKLRDDDVAGAWNELSMGMSADFEWAIEEGATVVRVGTAIFGPRPPVSTQPGVPK